MRDSPTIKPIKESTGDADYAWSSWSTVAKKDKKKKTAVSRQATSRPGSPMPRSSPIPSYAADYIYDYGPGPTTTAGPVYYPGNPYVNRYIYPYQPGRDTSQYRRPVTPPIGSVPRRTHTTYTPEPVVNLPLRRYGPRPRPTSRNRHAAYSPEPSQARSTSSVRGGYAHNTAEGYWENWSVTAEGSAHDSEEEDDHYYRYSTPVMPRGRASSTRRGSVSTPRSQPPPPPTSRNHRPPQKKATPADAKRAGIPLGYSTKNWDPDEEPILLLGSVFDANTLGKWIFDWTAHVHGPGTATTEQAGELWLLLIKLSGSIRRANETIPKIRSRDSVELVEEFIGTGERLMVTRLGRLLKVCESYMMRDIKRGVKRDPASVGADGGKEFVHTIFGHERELETCERWMTAARLWSARFAANCESILSNPAG